MPTVLENEIEKDNGLGNVFRTVTAVLETGGRADQDPAENLAIDFSQLLRLNEISARALEG